MVTVFVHENLHFLGNLVIETNTATLIFIQKLIFSDFFSSLGKSKIGRKEKKKTMQNVDYLFPTMMAFKPISSTISMASRKNR